MTLSKAFAICTMGAVVGSCRQAEAQQLKCGPSDEVEAFLKRDFNESAFLEADYRHGAKLQIFASPDLKTATIILKRPDGISCMMDEAENLRPVARPKPQAPTKEI